MILHATTRTCSVERMILHYRSAAKARPRPSLLGGAQNFALQWASLGGGVGYNSRILAISGVSRSAIS